jgi:hypothetical protein
MAPRLPGEAVSKGGVAAAGADGADGGGQGAAGFSAMCHGVTGLEFLTESSDVAECDDAGGQPEERLVDAVALSGLYPRRRR